jgi:hypothetical protein
MLVSFVKMQLVAAAVGRLAGREFSAIARQPIE